MVKNKRPINHEDVTEEDIRKHINRHKMLSKEMELHLFSKTITFTMLFAIWLFFTVMIGSILIRYALILIGLPLLVVLLQTFIANPKKRFEEGLLK